ncbi:hypothetical protein M747DRAFT_298477 [Aspergillus niger ATCC 13496]|nr:hypothetical protein M747DRAFT_298477 [Aspergillus niger ATCC 13496]
MAEFEGSNELHLPYVAKYTFGIGFAISIPLILVALSVDDIGDVCQEGIRRMRRWMSQKRADASPAGMQDNSRPTAFEIEKILSARRSRKSAELDTDFAGSLLPVSTRETTRTVLSRG